MGGEESQEEDRRLSIIVNARVLFTGSREFTDCEKIKRIIEQIDPFEIIVGDYRGVDTLVLRVAKELGINVGDSPYIADWDSYGRSAGPIRNKEMLKQKPDMVVAIFDDSKCKGTQGMVDLARAAEVPVLEFFL